MSLDFTDDQSTLVQVMAWCRQASNHYLSQCWPRSMSPYGITKPQWVNISAISIKYILPWYSKWYDPCEMKSHFIISKSFCRVCLYVFLSKDFDKQIKLICYQSSFLLKQFWFSYIINTFQTHISNWLQLSNTIWHSEHCETWASLDQVMAWCLGGTKPFPEPMLTDC